MCVRWVLKMDQTQNRNDLLQCMNMCGIIKVKVMKCLTTLLLGMNPGFHIWSFWWSSMWCNGSIHHPLWQKKFKQECSVKCLGYCFLGHKLCLASQFFWSWKYCECWYILQELKKIIGELKQDKTLVPWVFDFIWKCPASYGSDEGLGKIY